VVVVVLIHSVDLGDLNLPWEMGYLLELVTLDKHT
jgi:hypothetical protein